MNKLLIIEDELEIAELQKDYLEIEGFKVDIENDGLKGLKKAIDYQYDLIIVDIMLPGADGFSIVKDVRKEKDIPILVVSAKDQEIHKIRGLGLGADDYITKPFSPGELVARVKSHLSRYNRLIKKEGRNHEIISDPLVIDLDSYRVYLNKKEILFTAKEFELLVLLSSNPNIVFSKERIFNRIWGVDSFGDISTIAVHIQKIRSKIEEDPSNPKIIETIWGVGYRFNART